MPFMRELVANVSSRSDCGPLLLPPLNVYNLAAESKDLLLVRGTLSQRAGRMGVACAPDKESAAQDL
jgi:hypothetical protein